MRSTSVSDTGPAKRPSTGKPRLRLLLWAALCSLFVGLTGLGEPLEDLLRDLRNMARSQSTSGEVAIVGIDDRSLRQIGAWPWPRRHYATIIESLAASGAKQIAFDIDFSSPSNPREDERLQRALIGRRDLVTLAARFVVDPVTKKRSDLLPIPAFRREVDLASIVVWHNFRGIVRKLPYKTQVGGQVHASLAAKLAGASGAEGEKFPVDFALRPQSVPKISAVDVIEGRFDPSSVAGKSIIVGAASAQLGDTYLVPGHGMMSGVYVQALGAETLLAGTPVNLGWFLPLLAALALAGGITCLRGARLGAACAAAAAVSFLITALALEEHSIVGDVVPSLLLLLAVSAALAWSSFKQFYRSRGNINAVTGLPNLNVLREEEDGHGLALVVGKIHNYAEITSALSQEGEEKLVVQIAERLSVIAKVGKLYQSDEGIFAWLAGAEKGGFAEEKLDEAFQVFRSPLLILDSQVDARITFGVDGRDDQPLASRLGCAVVAADDAAREGLKWKQHDSARSNDIAWKLSLLSQLDHAIDTGDLWIAFQPKMDLVTRRIVGAEALARWDHPDKGAIDPAGFILAAEQSGRIGKLTDYVLAGSIEAAARLNRQGISFGVAVNLSARLIDGMALAATVSRLLAKHGLAPECLTLEITETAALAGGGRDLDILNDLRELGVQLAIDDYGTGLSTLDYLKRIPATEIKIDKSFVEAIEKSRSDRLMVHSTIQLAHSLGQKVVAEGVERPETLEMLSVMGCDIAQGYLIGRPGRIEDLERSLAKQRKAA